MRPVSDPSLRAAAREREASFHEFEPPHPAVQRVPKPVAVRSAPARIATFGLLSVTTVLLGLRFLASIIAAPLDPASAIAAPAWMVEVTTTGERPATAMVYGPEVGLQLVRVPSGKGEGAAQRIVPARLARGTVHFVSLGPASLHVHAASPSGVGRMSLDASGTVITAYQTPTRVGVRTGW